MYCIKIYSQGRNLLHGISNIKDIEFSWRVKQPETCSEIFCNSEEDKNQNEMWLRSVLPDGFEYVIETIR